jgi:hypothetical protein
MEQEEWSVRDLMDTPRLSTTTAAAMELTLFRGRFWT